MTQGIHPLAASMVNQLNRVDIISNNIANVNTTGFKEESLAEGTFNNYLKKANEEDIKVLKESEIINTIPKIDIKYENSKVGAVSITGNQLDFALIKEDSYFKVEDSKTKEVKLTRDGSFKILDGFLVTQNGNKILDNNNQPIDARDENFESAISVVSTKSENLDKIGNNNYKVKDKEQLTVVSNEENIIQGSIERSNVNSIQSMVTLIEAQRKFEQSQKAINGIDEINSKVIDSIGNNR
ncbi:MAG: flagellar hook-basal body complex protein [Campylobacterota bacterium]|nr:flagellar hook-basal body complex protein [Campylobacterota bacterium]